MTPIFLYGTLLDPGILARRSGVPSLARRLRAAALPGWRRVVLRGTPYPTLLRDPAATIAGALLRPPPEALRRLAAYEGASYRLVPVRARTARGPVVARVWVAGRWRATTQAWRG